MHRHQLISVLPAVTHTLNQDQIGPRPPQADAHAFGAALKNSEVFIVPGANHFFSREPQWVPVVDKIAAWLPH